ncbi:hypothetical protein QTG54_011510 [Skeletonema marinoi]|uniref:Uncharacterized protein n=1 Tax=Skeletonema marinoi TaxID=267567 RepID=A0AAD8Y1G0_9STRA|nr:hypothetical protein QTG54_011510 [Skeletonema marinoi]
MKQYCHYRLLNKGFLSVGHPIARFNLGCYEWNNGRVDRTVKHFIIAANLGDDESVGKLKQLYKRGLVSKEDFARLSVLTRLR